MSVFNYGSPGLGHVGSYQVSGKPFLSGGIDVNAVTVAGTPLEISFPSVTRWITVTNHDTSNDVKVAFSSTGFDTNNYFTVNKDGNDYGDTMTARLELKVTKLYLTGACTNCDVIVGLTTISSGTIINNWSGSEGI